jgi:hypothetical protein
MLILFVLLSITRKGLRHRIDIFGYRLWPENGGYVWFWLNAPGVMVHELSHALVVFLFSPWGFRVTSITFFRIKTIPQITNGRIVRSDGRQSLQLGEVQYVRPQGKFVSYIGDGLSGIAPLFGGVGMLTFLYWAATGYNLWDVPFGVSLQHPGWPWWMLLVVPYFILTVTSELWPSRQDWRGAWRFVVGILLLVIVTATALWYFHYLNLPLVLQVASFIAYRIGFALVILLLLDLVFLVIAEVLVQAVRR